MNQPFTRMKRTDALVTGEDVEELLMALAHGQGDFSEEEGVRLVDWAREQRVGALIVDMLIQGQCSVTLREGDEPIISMRTDTP